MTRLFKEAAMKIQLGLISIVLLMLVTSASAETNCLSGTYSVKGWQPGVAQTESPTYTGTATIASMGEVCTIAWVIGKEAYSGVGFYDADTKLFSAGYADTSRRWFGSILYRKDGKKLSGRWSVQGDPRVGHEQLTPQ